MTLDQLRHISVATAEATFMVGLPVPVFFMIGDLIKILAKTQVENTIIQVIQGTVVQLCLKSPIILLRSHLFNMKGNK